MPDERLPKKIFYGELQEGKRLKVARRNATQSLSEGFDIPIGNRQHRRDQSGEVSSTKEQLTILFS